MAQGYDRLTEREKQTLRLLLVGHDAKSMARHFGLSVHTINERLRDARRKLSVSSSKEAARLLREIEGAEPETVGDVGLGEAEPAAEGDGSAGPDPTPRSPRRTARAIGGLTMIALLAALLVHSALDAPPQAADAATSVAVTETAASRAARDWLELVDAGKWRESWAATGASFQAANSAERWRQASATVRTPLGPVLSRTLVSDQDTPSPPHGYRVVRFRTAFANRASALETLSLDREGDSWKVVGIYLE